MNSFIYQNPLPHLVKLLTESLLLKRLQGQRTTVDTYKISLNTGSVPFPPDIDECLSPDHGCEEICTNTDGSYVCNCTNGYVFDADGRTCNGI